MIVSVGRRDERGNSSNMSVVGFRGGREMEENELEEGEAFSGQEEEDTVIDPYSFPYIDEKIENCLGHFQKEFEGRLCEEILGSKFGGYGSFLPSHQRSPSILSQPKSPQKIINCNTSRFPHLEGTHEKIDAQGKNGILPMENSLDNSSKKELCGSGPNASEPSPQTLTSKPDIYRKQKTLKVRVKVGPEKVLAKNNAAIYSGLGLDVSSSPSPVESFDDSQGSSPGSHDARVDSAMMIYKFYTSIKFAPLDSFMLSPISKSLYLMEKDMPQLKEFRTGDSMLNRGDLSLASSEILPTRNITNSLDRMSKPSVKNIDPFQMKKSIIKDGGNDINMIPKREIDIETTAGREIVNNAQNIPDNTSANNRILSTDVMEKEQDFIKKMEKEQDFIKKMEKEQESTTNPDVYGPSNSGNKHSHIKTKLKASMDDKSLETKKLDMPKDYAYNAQQRDGNHISEKNKIANKVEYAGNKSQKAHVIGSAESVKLRTPQRAFSYEEFEDTLPQRKEKSSSCRRNSKGGQANELPSSKFLKGNITGVGSLEKREKKTDSLLKNDPSERKSKILKTQKNSNKTISKESVGNHAGPAKFVQIGDRSDNSESLPREKPRNLNIESKKGETFLIGKMKDKMECKGLEVPEPFDKSVSLTMPYIPTSTVPPLLAPHVVEDHWVCCDICEKWRLLPYDEDPDKLPKKWQCSMLNWLRGMNRCDISEEETTKALQALYHPPVAEGLVGANNHDLTTSGAIVTGSQIEFGQHILSDALKKKISQKDAPSITSGQINSIYLSSTSKERQISRMQSRSTDNQKIRAKEKHKMSERYSDGGESFEKKGKHSKSKSRRSFDQDKERNLKKMKFQESHYMDDDCNSNHSLGGKTVSVNDNVLSSKASDINSKKYKELITSKNSSFNHKEKSPLLGKKMKVPVHNTANGDIREQISSFDSEKSDVAKKRKVKDWQENEVYPQTSVGFNFKEATSEHEVKKDKKFKISKSDGRKPSAFRTDDQLGKSVQSVHVSSVGCQDQLLDGNEIKERYIDKDNQVYQRNTDGPNSSIKKDLGCNQPYTTATSSSSKVSSSRKSKANFQEARDSPVESVSSSPLRILNTDMLTKRNLMVKDDSIHVGHPVLRSPRKSSEGEADGLCNPFGAKVKGKLDSAFQNGSLESNRVAESSILDPTRSACDLQVREVNVNKAKDQLFTKIFGHTDDEPSPSEYEEINRKDGAEVTPKLHHKNMSKNQGKLSVIVKDKADNNYHVSGSNSSKKSGKSSSSRSREKHKSFKIDKGKMKASETFNDRHDLNSRKNEDFIKKDIVVNSNGRYNCLEDFKGNGPEKKEQKDYLLKISGSRSSEAKRECHSNSKLQEDVHGSSIVESKHGNSRVIEPAFYGNGENSHIQAKLQNLPRENEKASGDLLTDQIDNSEPGSGKAESSSLPSEKQDLKSRISCPGPLPVKINRIHVVSVKEEIGGIENGPKQPSKIESQNGPNHNSLRHVAPNRPDGPVPGRKEGGPAAILKEARDLKHTANRLKNEGLEQESTGLYFQAALKFLHVALLLEHSYFESTKQSDMASSIQMYSDTAKLCEFCAHEYEKHKQMAASALAYKCMEVAYMKVVYFKCSSANKDRHELQIAPQVALHGESPSSSASDVDNLNNSSIIDKTVSVKGVNSPQVAGNHIIAARHRPNFMRLLGYAEDVIAAMEASKKSLNAIAAASASLEGSRRVDAISSVKKVLDFNFHDVEGLLRLVRISVELVSS